MLSKANHSYKKAVWQIVSEMPINGGSRRCLGWGKSEPNYSDNQQIQIEFKVFDQDKTISYTSEEFDSSFLDRGADSSESSSESIEE